MRVPDLGGRKLAKNSGCKLPVMLGLPGSIQNRVGKRITPTLTTRIQAQRIQGPDFS